MQTQRRRPLVIAPAMSFLNYIHTRRYNFGRGAESSWTFIAAARGDPNFPDTRSWRDLRDYLVAAGNRPGDVHRLRLGRPLTDH